VAGIPYHSRLRPALNGGLAYDFDSPFYGPFMYARIVLIRHLMRVQSPYLMYSLPS
jgi:hypothetical protein